MVKTTRRYLIKLATIFTRVLLIFLVLSTGFDSLTRLYYTYMPIGTWMDFREVKVEQRGKDAVVVINRQPISRVVSLFHRTLLIKYPEEKRDCTNSSIAVLDEPEAKQIVVPLYRMLAPTCYQTLGNERINAVLKVSYIFEFPYGVKRFSVRYSNDFTLWYENGRYRVDTLPSVAAS